MLSPFLALPLLETHCAILPSPASMGVFLHPPPVHIPPLNSPTLGYLSSIYRIKDLSSH